MQLTLEIGLDSYDQGFADNLNVYVYYTVRIIRVVNSIKMF